MPFVQGCVGHLDLFQRMHTSDLADENTVVRFETQQELIEMKPNSQ